MKLKKLALAAVLLSAAAFTGCNVFSAPSSMIKPPESISVATGVSKNITDIAKKYLPKGSRLISPQNPQGSSGIQLRDIDGDKIDEIIALYAQSSDSGQTGLIVLKKNSDDSWSKIFNYLSVGNNVNYFKFLDITGDGNDDIVVGWTMGTNLNGLDIFSYGDKRVKHIASDFYSKLEIEDMPDNSGNKDNQDEIALWQHDIGEAYDIRVVRWNGIRLVPDINVYKYYYSKIVEYYKDELKSPANADFAYYWYYLADAQIKAGNSSDAYNSINVGLSIKAAHPDYYPDDIKFQNLKEEALIELNGMNKTLSADEMINLLNSIKGTYVLKAGENYEKTVIQIGKIESSDNYFAFSISNTSSRIGDIVKIIKLKDDNCYELQTIPGNSDSFNITIKINKDYKSITLLELTYEHDLENSGSMDVTFVKTS